MLDSYRCQQVLVVLKRKCYTVPRYFFAGHSLLLLIAHSDIRAETRLKMEVNTEKIPQTPTYKCAYTLPDHLPAHSTIVSHSHAKTTKGFSLAHP